MVLNRREAILMGTRARFLIVLGVAVFALLVKWFTLHFIATEQTRKRCQAWIGDYPRIPSFGPLFRSLGWELANAALGLMVLAWVLEDSNYRAVLLVKLRNYDLLFTVVCFLVFVILYIIAVKSRYAFLEVAERCSIKRVWCGLILWSIGLLMLLNSSWFVVKGQ